MTEKADKQKPQVRSAVYTNTVEATPWSIKLDTADPDIYNQKQSEIDKEFIAKNYKQSGESGLTDNLDSTLDNFGFIVKDLLAGDPKALERPEITCLNFDAIKAALQWLNEQNEFDNTMKADLFSNAWRLNFKCRPPTPEEFLTEKYIGPMAESLRPSLRDTFCEAFDPLKPYRTIVLTPHIGWGKSTWSVLANLFVSTHFAMMWHPYKYFNLAVSTMFTQVLGAWNLKKASELLMEPFMQILEASPYFKRVRTHTDLLDANGADLVDSLHYTTSAPTSVLQFQNGVNYKIINGPGAILGQTIIMGVISELTTFVDEGWSEEKILKFFTKLRKRIDSRMNGNYYGRFILDSQPNTLESCIDAWIWSDDTRKNSENYIVSGSRWKFMPEEFTAAWETPRTDWKDPINLKKDFVNSFPIFKGGNGVVPQVIESPAQLEQFDQHDVIWAPTLQVTSQGIKNYKEAALESPIEFLRDWAGIPSGAADRLFYDPNVVEDIFDNSLKNCFGGLDVPASEEPEHLIWNKVKDKFFNKIMDKYYFYYEPQIPRVASVDLAITGDVASISVSHVERSKDKKDSEGNPAKIYVTDFSIPVVPKNSIINMDAFKFFLIDLRQLGNMNIKYVSFDGFQSRSIMQSLQRHGFDVSLLSVDKETTPYQNMIDYAFHRRWVCGKSIMMKNNLLSLETTTRKQTGSKKIDHKKGENLYADDFCPINGLYNDMAWQHSQVGYYAKDLADTVCANIALIDEHDNEFLPIKVWEPMKATERTYEAVKANNNALLEKLGLRT